MVINQKLTAPVLKSTNQFDSMVNVKYNFLLESYDCVIETNRTTFIALESPGSIELS